MMGNRYVLDAWSVLALLQSEEPAASRVRELLKLAQNEADAQLSMSIINLGEVFYIIARSKGDLLAQTAVQRLQQLPITILGASPDRVFDAARLKAKHKLSYADAFAAAAAIELTAVLLTGDPELIALDGQIDIEQLGRAKK